VQQATQRTKVALFSGAPLNNAGKATPFLKWAGGKSELLPEIEKRLPKSFGTYWEPFIGGGAVYFRLSPASAVISDANEELANCYQIVRDKVDELIAALKKHSNNKEHFLRVRKLQPWQLDAVERAARLIYLNKTCYNGLFRVNQRGEFNVPFGRYENPRICDETGLREAARVLRGAEVLCRDFRHLLYKAKPGDFIYFDPPYSPLSETSSFTAYSDAPFDQREQKALRQVFNALAERGCHVMLSNSDTEFTRKLFQKFTIQSVQASRAINCRPEKRGKISELIITNY
jgi:DNA adenine methylase